MSSTILQIFLLVTVFFIGVCVTLAVQYGLAHRHEKKHGRKTDEDEAHTAKSSSHAADLPPEVQAKLLKASEVNFEAILDRTAVRLEHDLDRTAGQLNKILQKIGAEVVGNEMERYRLQLENIRKHAAGAIDSAQSDVDKHQAALKAELEKQHAELSAKLEEEMAAERQRQVQAILTEKQQILQRIDTKLADAVASFLLETLGHEVDLGAQQTYLTKMLDEHKDDFKRSLSDK